MNKSNIGITPKVAQKVLKDEGLDVSLAEAEEVLKFLKLLANISVSHYLRKR